MAQFISLGSQQGLLIKDEPNALWNLLLFRSYGFGIRSNLQGAPESYLENRSPWQRGWGMQAGQTELYYNRFRKCACGKTYRIWDCFSFLLAGYSDFPLVCLKPGLLTQENSHVCGVSLSPSSDRHVWKRVRNSNIWQLDTSMVLMWMCALVITNSRNSSRSQ